MGPSGRGALERVAREFDASLAAKFFFAGRFRLHVVNAVALAGDEDPPALGAFPFAGKADSASCMAPYLSALMTLLQQQMNATVSRSDALGPLKWLLAIVAGSLAVMAVEGAPSWLLAGMFALLVLIVGLYGYAYFHFMQVDRDALRSERFVLTKSPLP